MIKRQGITDRIDMIITIVTLKYFCISHGDQRCFFQFENIINAFISCLVLSDSFEYLCNGSTTIINISILSVRIWGRILVQVTIYRRLLIGRDGHLDQSEAYDIS